MRRLTCVIPIVLLCGCANLLVPRTEITGTVSGQAFSWSSPKNYQMTNFSFAVTQRDQFGGTNTATLSIGGVTALMDPAVVQMSGETFNQALTIAVEAAKSAKP